MAPEVQFMNDRQLFHDQSIGHHQYSVTVTMGGQATSLNSKVPRDHFQIGEGYGRLQLKQLKLHV